ncbi:hypothetical protein DFJ73DRAFT_800053 [Zopfochytrium polystomum]|nr:hypothetical protein DFJ73DRAFT_800053 [Zopfochytrium polystomum]
MSSSSTSTSNANRDEALRCLDVSKKKFEAGDVDGAIKFAKKSLTLAGITLMATAGSKLWKRRETRGQRLQRTKWIILFLLFFIIVIITFICSKTCRVLSFLFDLFLVKFERSQKQRLPDRTPQIKSKESNGFRGSKRKAISYRKLALQFHPDKCGAPGTDEAFKAIGHAFAVLGDERKKEQYDRFGIDPESSAGRSAASTSGGGPSAAFQRGGFGEEISPEDLFNMFFADLGGGGGIHFSAGPHFRRQFRFQQNPAFQRRQHQHAQNQQAVPVTTQLLQFLPFLIIFAFSIFSSFIGDSTNNAATFSFERTRTYSLPRSTPNHNVAYFVSPTEWTSKKYDTSPRRVEALDNLVESHMLNNLRHSCSRERQYRSQHIAGAYTLFGVHEERLKKAQAMPMPSCDKLVEWERVSDEIRRGLRGRKEKVGVTDATGARTEL